jgi:hypothetical protein
MAPGPAWQKSFSQGFIFMNNPDQKGFHPACNIREG